MTQRAVAAVGGRQRDVVAGQVSGALEARGVEVTGRALPGRHVHRAIGLEGRTDLGARRARPAEPRLMTRSEEHTSELQSLTNLVCRLLLEKKKDYHQRSVIERHRELLHPQ